MNTAEQTLASDVPAALPAPLAATPSAPKTAPLLAAPARPPANPKPSAEGGSPRQRELLVKQLPTALRQLLLNTPERLWHRLRGYHIETEVEGELIELLPDLWRAMMRHPDTLSARINRGELPPEVFDQAFGRVHDSIHGVKDALQELEELTRAPKPGPGPGPEQVSAGATLPGFGEAGRAPEGRAS